MYCPNSPLPFYRQPFHLLVPVCRRSIISFTYLFEEVKHITYSYLLQFFESKIVYLPFVLHVENHFLHKTFLFREMRRPCWLTGFWGLACVFAMTIFHDYRNLILLVIGMFLEQYFIRYLIRDPTLSLFSFKFTQLLALKT